MKKAIFIVIAILLISINGFSQETKPFSIIGKWESVEEADEKLVYIFNKEFKYTQKSSLPNPKFIDTGTYTLEKSDKQFKLTLIKKLGILNMDMKMNFLITFINADKLKLEFADPDEHGEFAELAAEFTAVFVRKND